jgi:hypothetical protein
LSKSCILGIEKLRQDWISKFPSEEPDVVTVSWGEIYYNNGKKREIPIVSFYTKEVRNQIQKHIQLLSGLEVVFFKTDTGARNFQDKVLDFSEEQGFFLREP